MKSREPVLLPEHDFPTEEWRLTERRFSRELLGRTETLFSVGNGYLGFRGNPEEGRPIHDHGTFVNGFHEQWQIVHAEEAYGLAQTGQTIIDVPDAKIIKLYVDDEPLYLPTAYLEHYERSLDLRRGILSRELLWETPSGKRVRVRSERFASTRHRHLGAISYEVTVLNADAPVVLSSQLLNRGDATAPDDPVRQQFDPRTTRQFDHRLLESKAIRHDDERIVLGYQVAHSGMTLGCGIEHRMDTRCAYRAEREVSADLGKVIYTVEAQQGEPIRLEKFASYHTSRAVPADELADRCERTLDRALRVGWDSLVEDQIEDVADFWRSSDVVVEGDAKVQQAVRWNLFQLMQASLRAEGTGIPAKGLSGHGYEGHYFWDIEIFVMPFLTYTAPRIARNLLRFRHSLLDKARERAAELSEGGALFPWRTINGEEASAYYQAGTAQYHIDADIAHALQRYVNVRGDWGFHLEVGAELLIETARLWTSLGFHDPEGRFRIHAVTGPDEYSTVVDDNSFTNLMAQVNLRYAVEVVRRLEADSPEAFSPIAHACGLEPGEVEAWEAAAEAMHVPYDRELGIHLQDTHFLDREVWDLDATPRERFPLLLHYHPLVIYRYQVIKQADVVLAMFLLDDEFDLDVKRRNFDYYDPLTTGDSSLSAAIQSIVAAEIGNEAKALEYFDYALMMDLADLAGNVSDGAHIASAGGVWQTLAFGFAGVRDTGGRLRIDPRLPSTWSRLRVPVRFQDRQLTIELTHETERYELLEGEALELTIRGSDLRLEPGAALELPAAP